jgi:hypothetical protein
VTNDVETEPVVVTAAVTLEVDVVVDEGLRHAVKEPTIINRPATINNFFFIALPPDIFSRGFD